MPSAGSSDISLDVTVAGLAQTSAGLDAVTSKLTKVEAAHNKLADAAKRAATAVKTAAASAASAASKLVQVNPAERTADEIKKEREAKQKAERMKPKEWQRGLASRLGSLGGMAGMPLQAMGAGGSNLIAGLGMAAAAGLAVVTALVAASDRAVQAAENETKARQEWAAKLKGVNDQRGASALGDYQKIRDPMRRLAAISTLTGNADIAAQAAKSGVGVDGMGGLADLLGSRGGSRLLSKNGLPAILEATNRLVASGAFADQGDAFKALGGANRLDSGALAQLAGGAIGQRISASEFDSLGNRVAGVGSIAAMSDTDKALRKIDASKIAGAMNGDLTWQGANNALLDQVAPAARAMSELGRELANLNEIAKARAEAEGRVSQFLRTFTLEGNETTKMIRQMRGAAGIATNLDGVN